MRSNAQRENSLKSLLLGAVRFLAFICMRDHVFRCVLCIYAHTLDFVNLAAEEVEFRP